MLYRYRSRSMPHCLLQKYNGEPIATQFSTPSFEFQLVGCDWFEYRCLVAVYESFFALQLRRDAVSVWICLCVIGSRCVCCWCMLVCVDSRMSCFHHRLSSLKLRTRLECMVCLLGTFLLIRWLICCFTLLTLLFLFFELTLR